MRLRPLSLAVTTVLAATACTLAAGPAQAAGNSLTVTTIGRNGARITSDLVLANTATGAMVQAKSGKAIALSRGQWSVVVDIQTPDKSPYRMSDTIAGAQVSVAGSTSLTLDARKGKPVTASVDATSGKAAASYGSEVTAVACPTINFGAQVGVYNVPGEVYEVPDPGATDLQFAWMQTWAGDMGSAQPQTNQFYAVTKETKGLPASAGISYRQASMAEVSLQMRNGETSQPVNSVMAQPAPQGQGCQTMLYGYADMLGSGLTGHAYLSPGSWGLQGYNMTGAQGLDTSASSNSLNLVAGHSYWQSFDLAVWGPRAGLPDVTHRSVTYDPYATIADTGSGTSGAADTHNAVTLSEGSKVLKRQTISTDYGSSPTFSAPISSAGWYDLAVTATRVLKAQLSTEVTLDWHFHASPSTSEVAPGYQAVLSPGGMNYGNAASPRTTTPVTITLHRTDEPWSDSGQAYAPESVKSVKVYASHDGGKTWQAVTAARVGSHWVAEVPEPAAAGSVALRTVAVDTAGDSSTQTVYNAYLVD